jgi:hypothetical protein
MQLLRAFAWASRAATGTTDRRDGVEYSFEHIRIVDVGCCVSHRQGDTATVDHKVTLRARFATIGGIGTCLLAPPGAATLAESSDALDQSIWSASPKRFKSVV